MLLEVINELLVTLLPFIFYKYIYTCTHPFILHFILVSKDISVLTKQFSGERHSFQQRKVL